MSDGSVAQVANLPYRRLAVGVVSVNSTVRRFPICDTADWQSALP